MVEVCGVRYGKGTSKRSGNPYEGFFVHYTEDGTSQGVKGYVAENTFISSSVLAGRVIEVGDKLDIRYDRRGFITGVDIVR